MVWKKNTDPQLLHPRPSRDIFFRCCTAPFSDIFSLFKMCPESSGPTLKPLELIIQPQNACHKMNINELYLFMNMLLKSSLNLPI